jgi:hypothetical protein
MNARTRNLLIGAGGGIVAALAYPIVAPIVKELMRPVTKALMRGSLLGFDYARTQVSRLSESLEDIAAEVSAEVQAELAGRAKATSAGTPMFTMTAAAPQKGGTSTPGGSGSSGPHSVS